MKTALVILLMVATNAMAAKYVDDPYKPNDLSMLRDTTMAVTIKFANSPVAVCDKESRKRGNKGFSYQVEACAFWTADSCTIVLPKNASQHTIGHEFLHCLKGDWHPQ